jgi:CBS-domain-containing membrane protein
MNLAVDRLQSLRVADVMSRAIVPIAADLSLVKAAQLLREHQFSAAPVVDAEEVCVGVLSATDFLKHMAQSPTIATDNVFAKDYMTTAIQSIAPEASILLAARIMCVEHLHRLFVLDWRGKPVGVISSMDIVAALTNAIDEMHRAG